MEEVYLSSADMMHRNLDRRVELMFPLEDREILDRIQNEVLSNALKDTRKIHWLQADGSYSRHPVVDAAYDSQTGPIARYLNS